jgi:hypothetical protein
MSTTKFELSSEQEDKYRAWRKDVQARGRPCDRGAGATRQEGSMKIETIETRKWTFTVAELKEKLGITGPGEFVIRTINGAGEYINMDRYGQGALQFQLVTVSEGGEVP